jgi:predicted PurR-regulated permease PerM
MGDGLRTLEDRTFLLLIVAVSMAFAWILWPFYGAVLWATILAIVFAPVCQRLAKSMGNGATWRPLPRSRLSWPSSSSQRR